jgi:hypothetical protein
MELGGEIVQRTGILTEQQKAEDPPRDARQAVRFEGEAHPLDEIHRLRIHGSPHSGLDADPRPKLIRSVSIE